MIRPLSCSFTSTLCRCGARYEVCLWSSTRYAACLFFAAEALVSADSGAQTSRCGSSDQSWSRAQFGRPRAHRKGGFQHDRCVASPPLLMVAGAVCWQKCREIVQGCKPAHTNTHSLALAHATPNTLRQSLQNTPSTSRCVGGIGVMEVQGPVPVRDRSLLCD